MQIRKFNLTKLSILKHKFYLKGKFHIKSIPISKHTYVYACVYLKKNQNCCENNILKFESYPRSGHVLCFKKYKFCFTKIFYKNPLSLQQVWNKAHFTCV